jgi:predicted XRE-type DNA-binding protein
MTDKALPPFEESTGNVFADLGVPNPVQEQLKAHLSREIYRTIKGRKLTQSQAAQLLGIHQSQVSALLRARPGTFSVGRLIDLLTALGKDIDITIHDKQANCRTGQVRVHAGEATMHRFR